MSVSSVWNVMCLRVYKHRLRITATLDRKGRLKTVECSPKIIVGRGNTFIARVFADHRHQQVHSGTIYTVYKYFISLGRLITPKQLVVESIVVHFVYVYQSLNHSVEWSHKIIVELKILSLVQFYSLQDDSWVMYFIG